MREGDATLAFTDRDVAAVTGFSISQLRRWDREGFFQPAYSEKTAGLPYARVYSFRDLVGLRTIAELRNRHRISILKLKAVAEELSNRGYRHWADVRLHVIKKDVYFQAPASLRVESLEDGQYAMLPVIDVIWQVETAVDSLLRRSPETVGRIEQHRHVMRNQPVVAGTRIPVAAVLDLWQAGYSGDGIREEYPSLTDADIAAALAHGQGLARSA